MISATCTGYDAHSGWPCGREAVEVVTAGCAHEHVSERSLCDWHAKDARDGLMLCGDCLVAPEPHDCPLVGRPTDTPGPRANGRPRGSGAVSSDPRLLGEGGRGSGTQAWRKALAEHRKRLRNQRGRRSTDPYRRAVPGVRKPPDDKDIT